jgi:hypothetical protein
VLGAGGDRLPAGLARLRFRLRVVLARWRALSVVIKAKLVAVEEGIVTFEEEFGMHMVLPNGSTVAEHITPYIDQAYLEGNVAPLLQIGS